MNGNDLDLFPTPHSYAEYLIEHDLAANLLEAYENPEYTAEELANRIEMAKHLCIELGFFWETIRAYVRFSLNTPNRDAITAPLYA